MSIYRKLRIAFFVASIASTAGLSRCDEAGRVVSEITRIVSASAARDTSEGETDRSPYADVAEAVVERARSLLPASIRDSQETVAGTGKRGAAHSNAKEVPQDE